MDVNALKTASGSALDAMGTEATPPLDRATTARGHGFDESDDSYRRRLMASVAGAAAAGALSQPAAESPEPAREPETKSDALTLKQDGPTVEEWVLAGYAAEHYPPHGYASRSTEEEIQAAITAQKDAASHVPHDEQANGGAANPQSGADEQGAAEKPLP